MSDPQPELPDLPDVPKDEPPGNDPHPDNAQEQGTDPDQAETNREEESPA